MILTPGSIVALPTITDPNTQGSLVPAGGMVADQYAGLGIGFGTTAVTRMHGTLTFAPVGSVYPGSPPPTSLNYWPGGAVQGVFVAPKLSGYATTNFLSVEFLGVQHSGLSDVGALVVFDDHGHMLGNPIASSSNGPHGGSVVTVSSPGIFAFAAYATLPPPGSSGDPSPWGIAQIEFGPLQAIHAAPEPGSLCLLALGLLMLGAYAWQARGRRLAQTT